MKRREKILVACAAALVGAALTYALVNLIVLRPLRRLDRQAQNLRSSNQELQQENNSLAAYRQRYAELRDGTFADTPLRASVLVSQRIHELARRAGAAPGQLTVQSFSRGSSAGSFREIGCSVQGRCSLSWLTNFLFLLKHDPYRHRVTNLDITPDGKGHDSFQVSLRYVTPVLDAPPAVGAIPPRKTSTTAPAEIAALTDPRLVPARATYDVIDQRNLFRPYLPPPPPAPPRPRDYRRPPPREPRPPAPPPTPSYEELTVTGLPAFGERREVHLTSPGGYLAKVHKVGDRLPVGRIALVDYRKLPLPGKPGRFSSGRVVLEIGRDYWAVELGQRLGQRRLLRPGELPRSLRPPGPDTRPAPASAPAS